MEILAYASLYAFKYLVLGLGHQKLKPYLTGEYAEVSHAHFQNITNAINQILRSKLTSSSDSDFYMPERILAESFLERAARALAALGFQGSQSKPSSSCS